MPKSQCWEIEHNASDETGKLADTFGTLVQETCLKAEAAVQIAKENLSADIKPASNVDVSKSAMKTMKESIQNMTIDGNKLVNALKQV